MLRPTYVVIIIAIASGGIFCSLPYHEDCEQDRHKAEGDIDHFVSRQVRGMSHFEGGGAGVNAVQSTWLLLRVISIEYARQRTDMRLIEKVWHRERSGTARA
jgi:hypothetical protein